jgi:hypothetical protein
MFDAESAGTGESNFEGHGKSFVIVESDYLSLKRFRTARPVRKKPIKASNF